MMMIINLLILKEAGKGKNTEILKIGFLEDKLSGVKNYIKY